MFPRAKMHMLGFFEKYCSFGLLTNIFDCTDYIDARKNERADRVCGQMGRPATESL